MQIPVIIPDEIVAQVQARGLTPESYVESLIADQAMQSGRKTLSQEKRIANLDKFFEEMSANSHKTPILSDEALTRESFYSDHD